MTAELLMRRERRLTRSQDFGAARRHGRSWADRRLVLLARRNDLELSRFGFSVGKRLGNAVVRNKIRRRLREVARLTPVLEGWDLVVIARRNASEADFHRLRQSVNDLLRRAGVLATSAHDPGIASSEVR